MDKPTVGFIGVGLMGQGMGANILAAGYPLVVVAHRNRAPIEALISKGASEAASIADLAAQCDVIHLCVSGSPQVEAVVTGENGIAANAKPGTVLIDCSTSDPVSTASIAALLAEKGIAMADAPLGGTPANAADGTLMAMVGADDDIFKRIEPIVQSWAADIMHLGPVGLGHKMKLINNFIAMGNASLLAEGLAIARKSGLSKEQFHSVIGASRMHNGFYDYDTFMKWVMERDENAHRFSITNAHKDMRYLANLAVSVGAVTPVQSVIRNNFSAMEAVGKGDAFVPTLADFIAATNGLNEGD